MAKLKLHPDLPKSKIDRNIYGFFSEHLGRCIYEGTWVGKDSPIPNIDGIRTDVVEALKRLEIPVLRWPGGCFADTYHWMDGVGPYEDRKYMINVHWGGTVENNHFGTHEFFRLCELLGCEPYICGNLGSGTVREMSEWIEYMTFDGRSPMADLRKKNGRELPWKIRYFGVGNENWGCGGNMTPEYYANEYKRYASYCRNYGENKLYKIACGPNEDNYHWTEVMMREAGRFMDGLSLHYYTARRPHAGPSTGYDEPYYFEFLGRAKRMEELVSRHDDVMTRYDPEKRVSLVVDEWGTWFSVEPGTNPRFLYQQNTMLDALVAGMTLNIFNRHSDRVRMACIAQTINVLQSVILTDGDKMILTPTFYVFEMYKPHMDAQLLTQELTQVPEYTVGEESMDALDISSSWTKDGKLFITVCNFDVHQAIPLEVDLGVEAKSVSARLLQNDVLDAHNTFEAPNTVEPRDFTEIGMEEKTLRLTVPGESVLAITVEVK